MTGTKGEKVHAPVKLKMNVTLIKATVLKGVNGDPGHKGERGPQGIPGPPVSY